MDNRDMLRYVPVGSTIENKPLVVLNATARTTKAGKKYLQLELFDAFDVINGNYWDWGGVNIPQKNSVLNVTAQITEWQGSRQLNIKALTTNKELTSADFAPASGLDVAQVFKNAYELMTEVNDEFLRGLALSVLEELQYRWMTVPGAKGVHHAYAAGTLIHCTSVARIAKAIALETQCANVDLCTVGGILHDIGKLYTYTVDGAAIEMTDEGMLYDHTFIGAEFIGNYIGSRHHSSPDEEQKTAMLRHIILSHHGSLEHGAVVIPLSIEAHIVHHADAIDAAAEQIRQASEKAPLDKWTDRIWALGNRPHLSVNFVRDVMKPPYEAEDSDEETYDN